MDDRGGRVEYSFSEAGRLEWARLWVDGQGAVAKADPDYNPQQGWLQTLTLQGVYSDQRVRATYGHDDAGRLTAIHYEHTADSGQSYKSLSQLAYAYDAASRIKAYSGPEGDRTYKHDKTGQLLEVKAAGGAVLESFDFDPAGNRDAAGYVTSTGNRMTYDPTHKYGYDDEGNTTIKLRLSDNQRTDYTWDHRNRLTRAVIKTSAGVVTFEEAYTYDGLNRRIGVWTDADGAGGQPGVQAWSAHEGDNVWADFAGAKLATRYLNGRAMDERYARWDAATGTVAFYLTDNVNSVRQVVTVAGAVVWSASYSAFGTMQGAAGTGGDRFTYTGREWHAGTGLYYYRARYYAAGPGRFSSEDPIGFAAGDPNVYRYTDNSPTDRVDPTGLWSWGNAIIGGTWGGLGGAIGAIILGPPGWIGAGIVGGGVLIGGILGGRARSKKDAALWGLGSGLSCACAAAAAARAAAAAEAAAEAAAVAAAANGIGSRADLPPIVLRPIEGRWPAVMNKGKVYVDQVHILV